MEKISKNSLIDDVNKNQLMLRVKPRSIYLSSEAMKQLKFFSVMKHNENLYFKPERSVDSFDVNKDNMVFCSNLSSLIKDTLKVEGFPFKVKLVSEKIDKAVYYKLEKVD